MEWTRCTHAYVFFIPYFGCFSCKFYVFFFLLLSHTAAMLCLCCCYCYCSTTGPHIHTNQANVFHYSCIHNNHISNNKTKLYNIDCGGFGKKRLLGAHVYVCAVLLRLHCRFLYGIIFQYWWHLMICSFLPLLSRLQEWQSETERARAYASVSFHIKCDCWIKIKERESLPNDIKAHFTLEYLLVPLALASVRMLNAIYRTLVGWYIAYIYIHTFTIHRHRYHPCLVAGVFARHVRTKKKPL